MSPVTAIRQTRAVIDRAMDLLGPAVADQLGAHLSERGTIEALEATLSAIIDALEHPGARPADAHSLVDLALDTEAILVAAMDRGAARSAQQQVRVSEGLSRLRGIGCTAELLDRVCSEVVRSCGLRRAVLSRIEDGIWHPWMAHFDGDPDLQQSFAEVLRGTTIDLADAPVERAVVEQRAPRIVNDTSGERAYGPIIGPSRSPCYVVAPIVSAGRVIGLLHADGHPDRTTVDDVDRDIVWEFADGFARIYERTELAERLAAQRHFIRTTFESLEAVTAAIDGDGIALAPDAAERARATDAGMGDGQPSTEIVDLLTEREREVLALMVRGRNNPAIAEELVIKVGTVKSHVKHILRKAGAANRAELISMAMGYTTDGQ